MSVLYQKYRPQTFAEIFGQNHIKVTLQNEILSAQLSHAYLFCGPRAVGKTTLARVLAKAVNCLNRPENSFEPCNQCPSCRSINNFSNLEVIEIDAASNTGVDHVRENIISLSRIKSSNNKYKVFIIDEVHMLSISAFNALLKTLEEPPAKVIFILCTTEIYKVPATIISRCERFDFKMISFNDMIAKLEVIAKQEKLEIEREVLELIALKADGHLRDAENLLSQIMAVSDEKIDMASANLVIPYNNLEENLKLLESLSRKDAVSAITIVNNLISGGINLRNFIGDLEELLRKMILNQVNDSLASSLGLDLSEKMEIRISELNRAFSLSELLNISQEFLLALKELPEALIAPMPLELAIINICSTGGRPLDQKKNPPQPELPTEAKSGNLAIKKEEIERQWPEFLSRLRPHNHSLSFVMQSSQIVALEGNRLSLAFKYKFHKDRLNQPEIKKIVEKVLLDVFKNELKVEALVDENLTGLESLNNNNEVINNLLKTFGGEVIN